MSLIFFIFKMENNTYHKELLWRFITMLGPYEALSKRVAVIIVGGGTWLDLI